jgi:Zn-dependent peptidase ImmA (M78 family)
LAVSRMDLADAGSGPKIVELILKAEPGLTFPVPICDLARQLDILDIKPLETDGFEGGLISNPEKSEGYILVNGNAQEERRRFTIGHELGHFLIPRHKPQGDRFLCSRADMRQWDRQQQDAYAKMEVEANEFAALLLMPPPLLSKELAKFRDPLIDQIIQVASDFNVSKEAAARAYAQYHEQPVAAVVTKDGRIDRIYKNVRFPRLSVWIGQPAPKGSALLTLPRSSAGPSKLVQSSPEQWLETEWGVKMPELYEQVLHQREGYALTLLWAELTLENEDEDRDEDRTSKERFRDRQGGWRR